jgi:hypothetical protein
MNLREYRTFFVTVTGILALLVASPALRRSLDLPQTEFFTELWILGPNHRAEDYPFNISHGENYSIYLDVGNHLGHCAYYLVEVKFRNQTQPAPNSFNGTSSSLPSLFNITAFVGDDSVWELPLTFSFSYGFSYGFNKTVYQVNFYNMTLNDVTLDLRGSSSVWNSTESRFYGNMIFELWLFNASTSDFQYHERFVDLKFNMTV